MPADSNRQTLSFVREATFGTTPATGMQIVPFNGGGTFGLSSESTRSQRVRTDAQLSESKRTGTSPNISIPGELSSDYDQLLRGAIRANADWTDLNQTVDDVTVDADAANLQATFTVAAGYAFYRLGRRAVGLYIGLYGCQRRQQRLVESQVQADGSHRQPRVRRRRPRH